MARAQSTQVYVVTGLVFFFGIVIGFKMVYDFMQKSAEVRYEDFQIKLKADIKAASLKEGAVQRVSYLLPFEGRQLCFYDGTGDLPGNRYISQLIEDGNNAFLISGTNVRPFQVQFVALQAGYQCFNATGSRVRLLLEGKDKRSLIKQAS